ncbi:MAG: ComF family protein [Ktedonobacteraceae bacterium]
MNVNVLLRHSRGMLQQILDTVFPVHCAGCQKIGQVLCPACIAQIQPLPSPICDFCGTPLSTYGVCKNCQYHRPKLSGQRAVSLYQEPLRDCIHQLKYDGNVRLAVPLGLMLAQAFRDYVMQADMLIPVPLHKDRYQQRGYNHALLLAEVCSEHIGVPLKHNILVRHRATVAQVDLHPRDRYQNVAGAFACSLYANNVLEGQNILIIDDVSTTGATLEACATPLFMAGAKEVWGLVLARPLV